MTLTKTGQIEVIIKAVEGKYLVLEDVEDKSIIYWPIEKLSGQIEISNKLTLELKTDQLKDNLRNENQQYEKSLKKSSAAGSGINESENKEEQMRKLLESLVN